MFEEMFELIKPVGIDFEVEAVVSRVCKTGIVKTNTSTGNETISCFTGTVEIRD